MGGSSLMFSVVILTYVFWPYTARDILYYELSSY